MKRVVNREMVAHLWAHQSQDEARNQQGNIYFRGNVIYSYGSHFPMAQHVERKGKRAVLFTSQTYSNTTARHLYMVRSALSHREDVIECGNVTPYNERDHKENLKGLRESGEIALRKAVRSRVHTDSYVGQAETCAKHHLAYRQFYGMSLDKPFTISEDWREKVKADLVKATALAKQRQAKLLADTLRVLKYWKQGDAALQAAFEGKNKLQHDTRIVPIALRVASNGTEVETTRGARIPLVHAQRIWNRVNQVKGTNTPYMRNGHTEYAGPFAIDEIKTDGTLRAGCHTIQFEAMAELAQTLGW